jgi:transcriptional regulator CtsR
MPSRSTLVAVLWSSMANTFEVPDGLNFDIDTIKTTSRQTSIETRPHGNE